VCTLPSTTTSTFNVISSRGQRCASSERKPQLIGTTLLPRHEPELLFIPINPGFPEFVNLTCRKPTSLFRCTYETLTHRGLRFSRRALG
jgi:hypothetical protein